MSHYENYDRASKDYDKGRIPVGCDIILQNLPEPIAECHVLDAGAGTGNYAFEIAGHVKKVTALEVNDGMLEQLQSKANLKFNMDKEVDVKKWSLNQLPLPFENDVFDAVMINQVAHHLDKCAPYSNLSGLIKEFNRVLKPGGVFLFSGYMPEQICNVWFYDLMDQFEPSKPILDEIKKAFIPNDMLRNLCLSAGFTNFNTHISSKILGGMKHFDLSGIFDEEYRNGHSILGLMKEEVLEGFLAKYEAEMEDGTFIDRVAVSERKRRLHGISSFCVAHLKK